MCATLIWIPSWYLSILVNNADYLWRDSAANKDMGKPLIDNLSSHKIKGVRRLIEKAGAEVLHLPPYSPDLNPIEKEWSKLKQILRSAKARTKEALEIAIAETVRMITPDNAKAWFNHCVNGLR
jgi:hypothetical protein